MSEAIPALPSPVSTVGAATDAPAGEHRPHDVDDRHDEVARTAPQVLAGLGEAAACPQASPLQTTASTLAPPPPLLVHVGFCRRDHTARLVAF